MRFAGTTQSHHRRPQRRRPPEATTGRWRWIAAALALMVPSACSGQPGASQPETLQVVGAHTTPHRAGDRVYFAPDGSAWIYQTVYDPERELCVGYHAVPTAEPKCVPWDGILGLTDVSWSSDRKRVLFTESNPQGIDESDVILLDVDAGRLDIITEDSATSTYEDDARIDILPFFGPDDAIFFFRLGSDDYRPALHRVTDTGVEPVEGGQLSEGWWPYTTPVPWGDNSWVFGYEAFSNDSRPEDMFPAATLTLDGSRVAFDTLWAPSRYRRLIDASNGTLLFQGPLRSEGNSPIIAIPEARVSVEFPSDDEPRSDGFGIGSRALADDGTHMLELRVDEDGVVLLTNFQFNRDGDSLIAEPHPVEVPSNMRLEGGFGGPEAMGWDGGTTLTAVGSEELVVFDVVSD